MSASSGVWKPELNTDWGAQGLVGTARGSPESPESALRGSDREARLCGVTVMLKGLCRVTDGSPQRREVVGRAAGSLEELLLDASETALTEETVLGVRVKIIGGLFPGQSLWRAGEKLDMGFGWLFCFLVFVASVYTILVPQPMIAPLQETLVRSLGREEPLEGRSWRPPPVFLPGESHGQRSLRAAVHRVTKSWT